ncbi:Uncharacterised protein [Vibrio cholerae]|nr:Uncharacterised protein [Vibrio cholerae]
MLPKTGHFHLMIHHDRRYKSARYYIGLAVNRA